MNERVNGLRVNISVCEKCEFFRPSIVAFERKHYCTYPSKRDDPQNYVLIASIKFDESSFATDLYYEVPEHCPNILEHTING